MDNEKLPGAYPRFQNKRTSHHAASPSQATFLHHGDCRSPPRRGLMVGDKLLPEGSIRDVHAALDQLPGGARLVFYRQRPTGHGPFPLRGSISRVHVNLDVLHVLDLGCSQYLGGRIFYHLLDADLVKSRAGSRELRFQQGTKILDMRFQAFCRAKRASKLVQTAKLARLGLSNLIGRSTSTSTGTPVIKAKGLESRLLFFFPGMC